MDLSPTRAPMTSEKCLLIISHSPSKNTLLISQNLLKTAMKVSQNSSPTKLRVIHKEALKANSDDVLSADAIVLFTPENLGYMSGGMKDFFDRSYYPCLEKKQGLPVCAIIRAGHDGTGTKRALESITTGLRWRWVQEPLILQGDWKDSFMTQSAELVEAVCIALQEGII